jgi:hypothetical protein
MTPNTTAASRMSQIHDLLTAEAHRFRDQALQFGERDEAAAEGHRADESADGGHREVNEVGLGAAVQLDRGDGRRRAAAHAVVERDHLRHVGHGDALAADPSDDAADGDGGKHQDEVDLGRARDERERRDGGEQHADAGPAHAAHRRDGELMRLSPRMNSAAATRYDSCVNIAVEKGMR